MSSKFFDTFPHFLFDNVLMVNIPGNVFMFIRDPIRETRGHNQVVKNVYNYNDCYDPKKTWHHTHTIQNKYSNFAFLFRDKRTTK